MIRDGIFHYPSKFPLSIPSSCTVRWDGTSCCVCVPCTKCVPEPWVVVWLTWSHWTQWHINRGFDITESVAGTTSHPCINKGKSQLSVVEVQERSRYRCWTRHWKCETEIFSLQSSLPIGYKAIVVSKSPYSLYANGPEVNDSCAILFSMASQPGCWQATLCIIHSILLRFVSFMLRALFILCSILKVLTKQVTSEVCWIHSPGVAYHAQQGLIAK